MRTQPWSRCVTCCSRTGPLLGIALDAVGPAEEPADEQEQSEEEELDDDPEVLEQQLLESVQFSAPPLPFSGRCFRLDDA